jgi:hypothetical protein
MASLPGSFGFLLCMLFGLCLIVDGIFYVFVGHPLPPFDFPS